MKIFFTKFNKSNRGRQILSLSKGFTLVETLVAISIFTGSILGLMSVLSQGIANTSYAKQKMIASYLAQEGIEYIRNMRDTYVLYSSSGQTGWTAFNNKLTTNSCLSTGNGCYFDADDLDYADATQPMNDLVINPCPGGVCSEIKYDSATGKYGYDSSWASSGFTRKIEVTQNPMPLLPIPNDAIKISSTVFWKQGSGNYSITFSEYLFNWVK